MTELVRLVYASKATFDVNKPGQGVEVEVGRILAQSRRNNARDHIGGVLYYGNGYFFQCLEGERRIVEETYQRIRNDQRHNDANILSFKPITQRLFAAWAMKYLPAEKNVREFLSKHGHDRFNPFDFKEEMLEQLVYFFQQAHQSGSMAEPVQLARPKQQRWWQKLGLWR